MASFLDIRKNGLLAVLEACGPIRLFALRECPGLLRPVASWPRRLHEETKGARWRWRILVMDS